MSGMVFANEMPRPAQIAGLATSLTCPSGTRLWALADFALLGIDAVASLKEEGATNALSGSPLEAFGEHAPHLIEPPSGDPSRIEACVHRLVRQVREAPAISWLRTEAALTGLRSLAHYLSRVRVEGNPRPVHCRFADTRVLPHVLEALSPAQRRRVAETVQQWHWFDRTGAPASLTLDVGSQQTPDPEPYLHFDIAQFRQVRNGSEADAIFKLLLEQTPSLVPASRRGYFHVDVSAVLETAGRYGVEALEDRLQFVVLSLSCGRDFHRLACLEETWSAVREGGARLSTRMASWDEAMWEQLEHCGRSVA